MSRSPFEQLSPPDVVKDTNNAFANPIGGGRAEMQLTNQADVSQAHSFFQPLTDAPLPNVKIGEGAMWSAHAAAMPPGGEPVSPLVQLIMRMPGFTGIVDSIFELFGNILHGDLVEMFNPAILGEHIGEAITGLHSALEQFHIPLDIMQANGTALHFDGFNFSQPETSSIMHLHEESAAAAADHTANAGAPIETADFKHAIFEKAKEISQYSQNSVLDPLFHHNAIAQGDNGAGVYAPSQGGIYQPPVSSTTATTTTPAGTPASGSHPPEHGLLSHHSAKHFGMHHLETKHQELAENPAPSDGSSSESIYTVHRGDSLWNIARRHLGDPSRWHEIYQMNSDIIGANPNLIHPGVNLRLPEGAGQDYIVQPGDNLWNIARRELGGGHRWGEIYKVNHDIIGSNPNLIHPGQHLSLGGGDHQVVADATSAGTTDGALVANAAPAQSAMQPIMQHHAHLDSPAAHLEHAHADAAPATHAEAPAAQVQAAAPTAAADATAAVETYPHSTAGSVKAETPVVAPVETASKPSTTQ